MNASEIIEQVGAEDWREVEREFGGHNVAQITLVLDAMFPHDDNAELAQAIYDRLNS